MNKKMTWAAVTVVLVGLLVGPARWAMPGAPAAALAKAPARKTTPARAPAPKAIMTATIRSLGDQKIEVSAPRGRDEALMIPKTKAVSARYSISRYSRF